MKRWALCFGVGLGLLMATACGREDATQDTASPGAPAAIQAPGGQAGAAPRVVDVTMSFIEPRFRPNPMVIQVGKPVQFKVTSADTRHTFVIDALGIAVEVPQKSLDETV